MDTVLRLNRLLSGEVHQKIAMLWGYADEMRYWPRGPTGAIAMNPDYKVQRILEDMENMRSMQVAIKRNREAVEVAGNAFLNEAQNVVTPLQLTQLRIRLNRLLV